MRKFTCKILSVLLVFILALSMAGCSLFLDDTPVREEGDLPDSFSASQTVEFNTQGEERKILSRTEAVKLVERSVVAIKIQTSNSVSLGSGIIVDINNTASPRKANEFYILTCHHVIDGKGDITVYVPDENCRNFTDADYDEKYAFTGKIESSINSGEITLVGGDKRSDVAVLKLDVTGTGVSADKIVECKTPIEDYSLMRGEDVFAIGNLNGTHPMTVTSGIISYIEREAVISSVGYMNLLQIDAFIYHGNSGGGLFNMYGELVGITNGGNENLSGLSYAIPFKMSGVDNGFINIAKCLIGTKTATNYGYVSGRWSIGFSIQVSPSIINDSKIVISGIVNNSNASKAGLQKGDIIKKISYVYDGKSVSEEMKVSTDIDYTVYNMYRRLSVGDSFIMSVERNNVIVDITVNIGIADLFCDTGA